VVTSTSVGESHLAPCADAVHAASLFIDTSFQRLGLGRLAIGLLEELAVELFHAKVLTLDTTAYHVARSGEFPDWKYVEVVSQPSNNSLWYKKLGYEAYGVSENDSWSCSEWSRVEPSGVESVEFVTGGICTAERIFRPGLTPFCRT
jgi:hypothetical protein